ncbi:MAG: hypothetical protein EKK50_11640 [Sphingomonadaceae bacterium]|nr:MAG: hypothetical protein EKK50_11640 [Sphingomonadaceae bacterium]
MRSSGARGRKIDNMDTLTKTIGGDCFDLCGDRVGRGGWAIIGRGGRQARGCRTGGGWFWFDWRGL